MSRLCSQCGNNGHNSRTCLEAAAGGAGESNGIILFGVRLTEGSFRKSASMNNLAQYEQPLDSNPDLVAAGYASDDVVHASARNRERKRGVPWTEEEHKLFLLGLQKVGKGDWRGISRNFVKTRTPTQVASHAQKYFLRRNNHGRRRRRSSLFDMTTDTSMGSTMEEDLFQQGIASLPPPQPLLNINQGFPVSTFPVLLPVTGDDFGANLSRGHNHEDRSSLNLIRAIPVHPVPPSSKMADLNLNHRPPPPPSDQKSPPARHSSGFQGMSGGFNGSSEDSIITVA